jgi:hypothetical protein
VDRDMRRGITKIVSKGSGGHEYPWGKAVHSEVIIREVQDDRPDIASVSSDVKTTVQLANRSLTWQGMLKFSSDRENFYYTYTRRLLENGRLVREKAWEETISRDHH